MSKRFFTILCILLFLILSSSINAGSNSWGSKISILTGSDFSSSKPLNYVPGELLVKYKPQLSSSAINTSHSQLNVTEIQRFSGINVHHVELPSGTTVENMLKYFQSNPDVEYAEPNYIYYLTATTPNDTYFANLWGLHNIGQTVNGTSGTAGADIKAPEAWDIATGNTAIVVAVIDSGVDYNHPDLSANLSATRYDFVNNDGNPMDSLDHGTHVAGTIAAVSNNNYGVTGVTWSTKIMSIRAANANGLLTSADIISAIDYARSNGARIINASFGGSAFSQATYDAISNARTAGILFVAAAGNDATNNDSTPLYPASYSLDNIISIAATDQNDNLSYFSNYGATSVHVGAPGSNIYSTRPSRQTISYDFDSGSMGSWTTGGTNNTWGLSSSQYNSGSYSLAVNPAGNYLNNTDSWALAPVLNLSSGGAKLTFYLKGLSQTNDNLYVEISTNGTTWTSQGSISGYVPSWTGYAVDLGEYDGQSSVYLRFRFNSNASTTATGFFIDNIIVSTASSTYTDATNYYQFMSGTSMAAPHVAGLAALIWGYKTSLTYSQVKDIILRSVDTKISLSGKMITGGRINALNALYYLAPQAPSSLTTDSATSNGINLTWIDNSLNESGFKIERKTGSSGTYGQIATASANATSYSDAGLTASTTYYYRIVSYTDFGSSSYSNEANATTLAASGGGGGGGGGGGCFIATAAFGSPLERHVIILRDFRDRYLQNSAAGKSFVQLYYRVSPPIADKIAQSEYLRFLSRLVLMPVIGVAYLLVNWGMLTTMLFLTFILLTVILAILTLRKKIRNSAKAKAA